MVLRVGQTAAQIQQRTAGVQKYIHDFSNKQDTFDRIFFVGGKLAPMTRSATNSDIFRVRCVVGPFDVFLLDML